MNADGKDREIFIIKAGREEMNFNHEMHEIHEMGGERIGREKAQKAQQEGRIQLGDDRIN